MAVAFFILVGFRIYYGFFFETVTYHWTYDDPKDTRRMLNLVYKMDEVNQNKIMQQLDKRKGKMNID